MGEVKVKWERQALRDREVLVCNLKPLVGLGLGAVGMGEILIKRVQQQ